MPIEIERKFLVVDDSWKQTADKGLACKQGYLLASEETAVRVRVIGDRAFLTIKGKSTGIGRHEFEYDVPVDDALEMLAFCDNLVEKTRYLITHAGMLWELDVFFGANDGLVVAEIELEFEEQDFELPDWAGKEVTGDIRYYNACLARNPFGAWAHDPA